MPYCLDFTVCSPDHNVTYSHKTEENEIVKLTLIFHGVRAKLGPSEHSSCSPLWF